MNEGTIDPICQAVLLIDRYRDDESSSTGLESSRSETTCKLIISIA